MEIIELRREIWTSLNFIPDWIDTKSEIHKDIWEGLQDSFEVLLNMVIDKILPDAYINKRTNDYKLIIDNLILLSDVYKRDILIEFMFLSIQYIISACLEEEVYEGAANLKKLNDLLVEKNKKIYE